MPIKSAHNIKINDPSTGKAITIALSEPLAADATYTLDPAGGTLGPAGGGGLQPDGSVPMNNDTFLPATNGANSGTVDLIKAASNDVIIIGTSANNAGMTINSGGDVTWNIGGTGILGVVGRTIELDNDGTVGSTLRLLAKDQNFYYGFVAPDTSTTPGVIWKLPATDGTAGQVLSTDNSANLSWVTAAVETTDASRVTLGDATSVAVVCTKIGDIVNVYIEPFVINDFPAGAPLLAAAAIPAAFRPPDNGRVFIPTPWVDVATGETPGQGLILIQSNGDVYWYKNLAEDNSAQHDSYNFHIGINGTYSLTALPA